METDLYINFTVAAKLRGAKPSTLVHQYVAAVAREEMERDPAGFARIYPQIAKKIADNSANRKAASRRKKDESLNGGPE